MQLHKVQALLVRSNRLETVGAHGGIKVQWQLLNLKIRANSVTSTVEFSLQNQKSVVLVKRLL
jgi:hypothetical protein